MKFTRRSIVIDRRRVLEKSGVFSKLLVVARPSDVIAALSKGSTNLFLLLLVYRVRFLVQYID